MKMTTVTPPSSVEADRTGRDVRAGAVRLGGTAHARTRRRREVKRDAFEVVRPTGPGAHP